MDHAGQYEYRVVTALGLRQDRFWLTVRARPPSNNISVPTVTGKVGSRNLLSFGNSLDGTSTVVLAAVFSLAIFIVLLS